jgi:transposase
MSNLKPRFQGKIAHLPPEQREQIQQWLRENRTYSEITALCKSELGLSISGSALSAYYRNHGLEFVLNTTAQSCEVELILHIQIRPELRFVRPRVEPDQP